MMRLLALLALLFLWPASALAVGPLATPPANLDLFLLIGQSNMSGGEAVPPESPTDARVFTYALDNRWHVGQESNHDATNQVYTVNRDSAAGYGPGESFGIAWANASGHNVGLVPCAYGGSTIVQWQRDPSRSTLYGACLARAEQAQAFGHVAGVLVFQGEQEAVHVASDPIDPPQEWGNRFRAAMTALRIDLHAACLPVVYVRIPAGNPPAVSASVVQAQQDGAALECAAEADASDQPTDGPHLFPSGQDVVAGRMATAMASLIGVSPTATSTPAPTATPGTATLTLSPALPANGTSANISWNGFGNATVLDWIEVAPYGTYNTGSPGEQTALANQGISTTAAPRAGWYYTSCSQSMQAATPLANGACTFVFPAAGLYEIRFFSNNGYTLLARSAPIAVS